MKPHIESNKCKTNIFMYIEQYIIGKYTTVSTSTLLVVSVWLHYNIINRKKNTTGFYRRRCPWNWQNCTWNSSNHLKWTRNIFKSSRVRHAWCALSLVRHMPSKKWRRLTRDCLYYSRGSAYSFPSYLICKTGIMYKKYYTIEIKI